MKEEGLLEKIVEFLARMRFLRLTSDAIFKAYFTENRELLMSLLEHFLPLPPGSEVLDVDPLNTELTPEELKKTGKTYHLDLRVKFARRPASSDLEPKIEIVNVETQTTAEPYFTDRILTYSSRLVSMQLKKGDEYKKLLPVYSLVFTTENLKILKEIKNEYVHNFLLTHTESSKVIMTDKMAFTIVELNKFRKKPNQLENTQDYWSYLLRNSENLQIDDCNAFLKKGGKMAEALKHLWNLSEEEKLREYQFEEEKRERDKVSRESWIREEGEHAKALEIARKALASGAEPEFVAKITGLPLEEVRELAKQA